MTTYVVDTAIPGAYFDLVTADKSFAQVKFNKPIDPATVATGLTMTVGGVATPITGYFLTNNNQIVNIYYGGVVPFDTLITVTTTSGLKTADAAYVAIQSKTSAVFDITAPTFVKTVTFTTARIFTLTATEDLAIPESGGAATTFTAPASITVKIDGTPILATVVENMANHTLTFTLSADLTNGTHNLEVSAYTDLAGIVGNTVTIPFTYTLTVI
jgi:hypothetical protein